MTSYIIIGITSFLISGVTLFSGFGLGTALLPVFAVFFPLDIAIAATAIVHLANNIIKGILVGKYADMKVTLRFSLPAIIFAFIGAWLLNILSNPKVLFTYSLFEKNFEITIMKFVIGFLMGIFSLFELSKNLSEKSFSSKFIPFGGALSGFFGGLSGHQGAFRSSFLLKAGLSKESFIGTAILSAILVDIARLSVYGITFISRDMILIAESTIMNHIIIGIIAAFSGVYLGSRYIQKVTYRSIQILIGILLLLISAGLMTGVI